MTLKLKTPPMPEQAYWGLDMYGSIVSGANNAERANGMSPGCTAKLFTAEQLAARDAQWLELVGPVVEALSNAARELLAALDFADEGCRDPIGPGWENGHGQECGSRIKAARDNLSTALRAITEEQE